MIISATGGKKDFAPCPEFSGRAVCVDVTPLKEYETQYGVKQKFKFAFEIELQDDSRDPVQPWVVFTKPMVPSLHEKAALTKFLKDWFGRKLTDVENKSLDLESLLGRPASIVIGHEQSEDGSKTYANIKLIMPHKSGEALAPSGLWVRLQDRPPKDENGKTPLPSSPSNPAPRQETDILKTQVHVGKFRGVPLCDLNDVAVQQLAEHWIPKAMSAETISPADKQLIKAINARLEAIKSATKEITADDDIFF